MIIKIMIDVRHFLFIMLLLCLGFAMAFAVAIPHYNPIAWLVWMVNTGVYGYSELMSSSDSQARPVLDIADWEYAGNLLLFEVLMVIVALILLNLLIAIMNSAYESVKLVATLEVMQEKATIILDIERLWLPLLIGRFALDTNALFPRWLHLLVPVTRVG